MPNHSSSSPIMQEISKPILVIDPEFEALIPALAPDEYDALESSLVSDGCRDALVVWADGETVTLVDGHNRYHLCQKHALPFTTIEHAFDSREDVIVWMVKNQLARRNLAAAVKIELALKSEEAIAQKAKANEIASGRQYGRGEKGLLNSTNPITPINTRAEIAAMSGTSEDSVRKVKATLQNGPDFVIEKMRRGEISIHRAEGMSDALKGMATEVLEVVEWYEIEDLATIALLSRLHENGSDTFDEVYASGVIQISDENDAVPITAPSASIYKAVEKKTHEYKQIARDERNVTLDLAAQAAGRVIPSPIQRTYGEGEIVKVGRHTLICGDNRDVADYLKTLQADFVFADPPYNANAAAYDDGSFIWDQDFLIECAPIVAVTPGISSIQTFMKLTAMPYKWSTSCYINNGMTRGALGFGNWIYTALFTTADSLHRNAQDVITISISSTDKDETSDKRQKPPRYLTWLFNLLVPKGGVIIDAFGGSGMSVLVADQLGMTCIAIEKDPNTFAAMVARVEKGVCNEDAV